MLVLPELGSGRRYAYFFICHGVCHCWLLASHLNGSWEFYTFFDLPVEMDLRDTAVVRLQ
jgi:hypothetical protein